MLDPRYVADNVEEIERGLSRRSAAAAASLGDIAALGARRRDLIGKSERLKAQRNQANQEMSALAKTDRKGFEARRETLKVLGDEVKQLDGQLDAIERQIRSEERRV